MTLSHDDDAPLPHPVQQGCGATTVIPILSITSTPHATRRRRLWELGGHTHGPLLGACLPLAALRCLVDKAVGAQVLADDHELHHGATMECKARTPVAVALQRELDRRHKLRVDEATRIKGLDELARWWSLHSTGIDVSGALWAVLTHPCCTPALEQHALADVQMRQHALMHVQRDDSARRRELAQANAKLQQALQAAQARSAAQLAEQTALREALQAEAIRLRGRLMARDALLAQLNAEIESLRQANPDLPHRLALATELQQQTERARELQRALTRGAIESDRAQPRTHTLASAAANDALPTPSAVLSERAVLCVGGRTSAVPLYRRLVEDAGARFLHHDGGEEDNVQQLESTLAAADLVICQAGCVSHDAYWRVKDHCKRTGKRCMFVRKPSAHGLRTALLAACDSENS